MTRALVVGSSHIGALRGAAGEMATSYPDLDVQYFGVMGPNFLLATLGKDQLFRPRFRRKDVGGREFALKVNGADHIDTSAFDHVLSVGHRFGFDRMAALLAENDVLEGARSGRARVIPRQLLSEVIETMAGESTDIFIKRMRGRAGLSVALAPYPSTGIVGMTKAPAFARICAALWAHPDAEAFFHDWLRFVDRRLEHAGHRLLPQPAATVAGPFATKPAFAVNRRDMKGGAVAAEADHRHMNAAFGQCVLDAFARQHLGLTPNHPFSDAAE
ncbi:MAG: hypothetical protein AAGF79_17985 [Pseudomonadota bacterium]